jgi:hypothetical protein
VEWVKKHRYRSLSVEKQNKSPTRIESIRSHDLPAQLLPITKGPLSDSEELVSTWSVHPSMSLTVLTRKGVTTCHQEHESVPNVVEK